MEGGLREIKKQRTREAISAAALDLFDRNGFEATTIADIAAAADIAPRTFFGYFPSKEAVLFDHSGPDFQSFQDAIESRPEGVTTMDAMRAWIQEMFADKTHDESSEAKRRRCIEASPELAAYQRGLMARFGEELAKGVARDLGVPESAPQVRMTAAAAVATFESLGAELKGEQPEDPMAVVDQAIEFIAAGIAALQARERS